MPSLTPLASFPFFKRACQPNLRRALLRTTLVLAGLGAALCSGPARAQAAADPAADLGPLTQRWLDDALARNQPGGLPLRMEVSVGTLDSRLRLAPCARPRRSPCRPLPPLPLVPA